MDYLDYEDRYENTSITHSCLGLILNIFFVVAVCVGLYYGYIYLRDNVFNEDTEQTTQSIQHYNSQTEDEYICGPRWDFWNSVDCENESGNTDTDNTNNDYNSNTSNNDNVATNNVIKEPETTTQNLKTSGIVYAYEIVDVKVSNAGTISDLNKSVGDNIKYGDKIATITTGTSNTTVSNENYTYYVNQEKELVSQVNALYNDIYQLELAVRNAQIAHNNIVYQYNDSTKYYYNEILIENNALIAAENRYLDAKEIYYQATHERYEVYISTSEALRRMENTKYEYEKMKNDFVNLENTRDINLDNYLHDIETAKNQISIAENNAAMIIPTKNAEIQVLLAKLEDVKLKMNGTNTTTTVTTTNVKEITSPITGKILNINSSNEDYVNYGETILTIENTSKVKVVTYIQSNLLTYVQTGNNAIVKGQDDVDYKGIITYIGEIDPDTKKAKVEVEIPNDSGKFQSGTKTNITFTK